MSGFLCFDMKKTTTAPARKPEALSSAATLKAAANAARSAKNRRAAKEAEERESATTSTPGDNTAPVTLDAALSERVRRAAARLNLTPEEFTRWQFGQLMDDCERPAFLADLAEDAPLMFPRSGAKDADDDNGGGHRPARAETKAEDAAAPDLLSRLVGEELDLLEKEGADAAVEIPFDSISAGIIGRLSAGELAKLLEETAARGVTFSEHLAGLIRAEWRRREEEEVEWEDFPVTVDSARLSDLRQAAMTAEALLWLTAHSRPERRDVLFMDESPVLSAMLEAGEALTIARENVRRKPRRAKAERRNA